MGMFTSIIHPKDGRELQIKTGYDDCDTYHVGDIVPFKIYRNSFYSGGIFDDVYESYSDKGSDDWVIIKNHKIVSVRNKRYKYKTLYKQYYINKPDKKLWTNTAYKRYKEQQEKFRKESKSFEKSISHLSDKEKFAEYLVRPFKDALNRESFARKIFKVKKIK